MSVKQALEAHEVAARIWRFEGTLGCGTHYLFRRGYGSTIETWVIDIADFWGGDGAIGIRLARAVVW